MVIGYITDLYGMNLKNIIDLIGIWLMTTEAGYVKLLLKIW